MIEILDVEGSEYMHEVSSEPGKAARHEPSQSKQAQIAKGRQKQISFEEPGKSTKGDFGDAQMHLYEDMHDNVAQESSVESDTETVVEEVPKPHLSLVDDTNQLALIKPTPEHVRKVFEPEGFTRAENFDELCL